MNAGGVDKACKSCDCSLQLPGLGYRLMNTFRFMRLRVCQDAKLLHRKTIFLSKDFPREFLYLKDQLRRAMLSVVLNIAEGSAKDSDKDFNRYIQNALGSINESAACMDIAAEENLVAKKDADVYLGEALRVKDSLGAFSKRLKS